MTIDPGSAALASSALSAGAGMFGANKAGNAAEDAARQQRLLSEKDLAFRQMMYEDEKRMTQPLRNMYTRQAMSDQPLDYEKNYANIRQGYSNALRNVGGLNYMTGVTSGLTGSAVRGANLAMSSDLANAYAQGMQSRRALGMQMLGRDQSTPLGLNYSQGLGNMANFYGQQAGMYNQAAAQNWQNVGRAISGYGQYWASRQAPSSNGESLNEFKPTLTPPASVFDGSKYGETDNAPLPPRYVTPRSLSTYSLDPATVMPYPPIFGTTFGGDKAFRYDPWAASSPNNNFFQ